MSAKRTPNMPSPCICINVRRASRAVTRIYDTALESSGLKVTQFSILKNLHDSGPLNISTLAKRLTLDRTTLVRNLKPLEAAGFIENTPSSDPRERQVSITLHGLQTVLQALPHWKKAQQRIKGHINADSLLILERITTTFEELARETPEEAPAS